MIPSTHFTTIAVVALAFVIAAVVVRVAHAVVRRLVGGLDMVDADNRTAVQARATQLIRALTVLAYGAAALASVSVALARFGVDEARWDPRTLGRWFATRGINVLVIFAGAFVVMRAASLAIEHLQFKLSRRHAGADLEWQRRATTLGGILTSLVTTAVAFVAVLMLLRELSVDIMPILTGAGIAGLAIGFGAQNLVRDVISGFFVILEDQVRIGDRARINGVAGVVEQINLRTIVLRDVEGAVQVFPNGNITALANLSKLFAYAVVDLKIMYQENVDRVLETMRDVGASMEKDPLWRASLLEPLEVEGVVSLLDSAATLRVKFKTLPLDQGKVANEFRRRLMTAIAERGIQPYSQA